MVITLSVAIPCLIGLVAYWKQITSCIIKGFYNCLVSVRKFFVCFIYKRYPGFKGVSECVYETTPVISRDADGNQLYARQTITKEKFEPALFDDVHPTRFVYRSFIRYPEWKNEKMVKSVAFYPSVKLSQDEIVKHLRSMVESY